MDDRSLLIMNEQGDTTLVWTEDKDAEMRTLIERKMKEGYTFYLLAPSDDPMNPKKIEIERRDLDDAVRKRVVVMKDKDFADTVLEGLASIGRMVGELTRLTATATTSPDKVIEHRRAAVAPQFRGG